MNFVNFVLLSLLTISTKAMDIKDLSFEAQLSFLTDLLEQCTDRSKTQKIKEDIEKIKTEKKLQDNQKVDAERKKQEALFKLLTPTGRVQPWDEYQALLKTTEIMREQKKL